MTEPEKQEVAGEHALREGEMDRLGFAEIANRISASIVDRASVDGLVIGLDGQWGSGKSSLLHLIDRSLRKLPEERQPTIINFRPWLVGNRDALLTSLMDELADKIAHVHLTRGNASPVTVKRAKEAAAGIRKFATALSKAGDFLETAGELWVPLRLGGKALRSIGVMSKKEEKPTDLAAMKDKVVKDLLELNHRFIITVDDVDRLEPGEAIEVLRLVRSVADFPHVIYLLCYDAQRLAEAIKKGASIKDGAKYLEKIVQLTVMIPKPETFVLREWLYDAIPSIVGSVPDHLRERLRSVIDQEGGIQLRTPRSVVRTLDSIRFFWPALQGENIDLPDLVWLQLIKDGNPRLYRWIEDYMGSAAAISFGTARIYDASKADQLKDLVRASNGQLADLLYRNMFADILPGIEASLEDTGAPVEIFEKVSPQDRRDAIAGRRLASPDHYRLYFSLIGPTHAITQAGFDDFWSAADTGPEETANLLLDLHSQKALGRLRKSDVLFERLRAMDASLWTSDRARNLLLAFGQMLDEAYRRDPSEEMFLVTSWDRADRLVLTLYSKIDESELAQTNEQLFRDGRALGWLTSILRTEIFAHGRFGNQKKPESEWMIPGAEFDRACELMVERYASMSIEQILATPRPVHLLYAWNQAGDESGPRELVASWISTDDGLVNVLGAFGSYVTSSDRGRYVVLNKDSIAPFMDFESAMTRVRSIANRSPSDLSEKARLLVAAADNARDY